MGWEGEGATEQGKLWLQPVSDQQPCVCRLKHLHSIPAGMGCAGLVQGECRSFALFLGNLSPETEEQWSLDGQYYRVDVLSVSSVC